jgi:hypothetical protein
MVTEQERLQRLYAEMGDEHLLDMAEEEDDLTDEARLVLAQELRRRGITPEPPPQEQIAPIVPVEEAEREAGFTPGIPGMFPSSASMMEQALEAPHTNKDGLVSLISFYDGMELSKACAILEEAEMEPVIEPIAGDAMSGVPPRFEVWLEKDQIEPAKNLLRLKMGLFPAAEVDSDEYAEAETTGLVGVFETVDEAEEIRGVLTDAGFVATVVPDANNEAWEVVVAPGEQERALAVVAGAMGLG